MTDQEFKKMKLAQIEIMDEVHRLCEENGIEYYLIAGSALGAVRHGGFIPWDFDIDVGMRRAEYERFREVCLAGLSERFIYRDFRNTPQYSCPHALVCIKNTYLATCFDKFNPGMENYGISIDIFPLDAAPSAPELREAQEREILAVKARHAHKLAYLYDAKRIKGFVKKMRGRLMFWTTLDKINAEYDRILRHYDGQAEEYLGSFTSPYRYAKECMPAAVYGKPVPASFEGRTYYIPEQAHAYLTQMYGNYMELPPVEKREENRAYMEKAVFDR